jgi:DNA repair protein SbcC/Rad50
MPIEQLYVSNFECHDKASVTFDPGLTFIIGDTDQGKSSLIRAMLWALTNKPRGNAFIKHGEDKAAVKVVFDSGQSVVRSRGKRENVYKLDSEDFKAFGNEVPQQIRDALKLSEASLQGQHDSAFWLSMSPPEFARKLNEMVDMSLLDEANRISQKRMQSARAKLSQNTEMRDAFALQLVGLDWTDECNAELVELEGLENHSQALQREHKALSAAITEIEISNERINAIAVLGKESDECIQILQTLEETEDDILRLTHGIHSLSEEFPDLSGLSEFDLSSNGLEELEEDVSKASHWIIAYGRSQGEVEAMLEEIGRIDANIEVLMSEGCPVCGK